MAYAAPPKAKSEVFGPCLQQVVSNESPIRARVVWVRGALGPCRCVVWRSSVLGARCGRGLPVKEPGLIALQGREISGAVYPLDLGWPAVAVRAGVGLVYSVFIEEVVTPRSVGGRTGANTIHF